MASEYSDAQNPKNSLFFRSSSEYQTKKSPIHIVIWLKDNSTILLFWPFEYQTCPLFRPPLYLKTRHSLSCKAQNPDILVPNYQVVDVLYKSLKSTNDLS